MNSKVTKPLIGLTMVFAVGFVCAVFVFAIPSPSLPVVIGALIVMGMTGVTWLLTG